MISVGAHPDAVLVGIFQLVRQRLAVADGQRPPRPFTFASLLHVLRLWTLPRRLCGGAAVRGAGAGHHAVQVLCELRLLSRRRVQRCSSAQSTVRLYSSAR